ncbi:Uu.00g139180.m01.CDS01 [Anthostomella pinea]|uniref:Peroxidase n=1 Tax=Anthostomella pinea TaxID=933095 RepID=A0AAI8VR19_9PEZI|nr:Uu.00g139180.m01.CDS01 [Anthostomella pinea]
MMATLTALCFLVVCVPSTGAMFYYPSPAISLLEHILVDNWGAYASNFSAAITPCTNYVTEIGDAAPNSGRTTAAQWLRVGFHDFVTADVAAGTGGLDASIGFETFRDENKGSAFNDSFTFWRPFVNEFVPMADLVALGTVMSVNLCGGKYIPFRPGRVDATGADPTTGVPEPGSSLEETLAQFGRSGFNQADSIGLTACGHTMGSAHHSGFPEVSDNSTLSANNTNGGINFDTSRGAFDPLVVHEYIDGTGNRGGPLVTSFNETSRSDLRLYESDGNATMEELYAQGDGFQDTCVELLSRMLNTVPAQVVLQDAIQPVAIKPVNVTWDIIDEKQLVLSGKIRILDTEAETGRNVTISFSNGYSEVVKVENATGVSIFGVTQYAPFSIDGSKITDASSFTVLTDGLETAAFDIQDRAFIVPGLTEITGNTVFVTIAADANRDDFDASKLTVRVATPITQPLTLGPRMAFSDVQLEAAGGSLGDVRYWSGVVVVDQPVGAVSVRLSYGEEPLDIMLLDAGVAGW